MWLLNVLLHWVVAALTLLLIAAVVPGVSIAGFWTAVAAALILGLVNMVIRPVVMLLTLPINVLTLGLFAFVVNALMFGLTAWLVPGFGVAGFWPALLGALLLSLVNAVLNALEENRRFGV